MYNFLLTFRMFQNLGASSDDLVLKGIFRYWSLYMLLSTTESIDFNYFSKSLLFSNLFLVKVTLDVRK